MAMRRLSNTEYNGSPIIFLCSEGDTPVTNILTDLGRSSESEHGSLGPLRNAIGVCPMAVGTMISRDMDAMTEPGTTTSEDIMCKTTIGGDRLSHHPHPPGSSVVPVVSRHHHRQGMARIPRVTDGMMVRRALREA
jgi:hypothetical protein